MRASTGILAMHDGHATGVLSGSSSKVLAMPEMLDAILSYLHLPLKWDIHSDRAALRACTLVNRQWSDVARLHLWSALSFAVIMPGAVDDEENPLKPSSLERLHEFLTSSLPIRQTVRSLKLVGYYGHDENIRVDATTLYSILSILPALQHLILDAICPRLANPPREQPRLSVRSIEICEGRRDYEGVPANILMLTDIFSDVRELVFEDYWLVDLYGEDPSVHQTRVTSIEFVSAHDTLGLTGVLKHFHSEHLTAVTLAFSGVNMDSNVEEAVLAVGSSRTEIGIRLNDQVDASEAELKAYVTVLSACRCLRRIRFIFDRWRPIDECSYSNAKVMHRAGWRQLLNYMSHIPDTVEWILIDFSCGAGRTVIANSDTLLFTEGLSQPGPEMGKWREKFEIAVASRQRETRVRLVPGGKPAFSLSEQAELEALFPKLSASGLLDF